MSRATRALILASVLVAGCSVSATRGDEVLCALDDETVFVLVAQAVPSATLVPCLLEFPAGWTYGGSDVRDGLARYWLESDRAGPHAVEVALSRTCDVSGLRDRSDPATELGIRAFDEPLSYQPYNANRYFVFEGGCVVYRWRFSLGTEEAPNLAYEAVQALTFLPRAHLVRLVDQEFGLTLCGAEASRCVDGS
ncbi:MAG: hypothetical protein WD670_01285 [Actinomycetota bacterium]